MKEEGFRIVSGGTDNHLILVDVKSSEYEWKACGEVADEAGITCNKNTIPFENRKPFADKRYPTGDCGNDNQRL